MDKKKPGSLLPPSPNPHLGAIFVCVFFPRFSSTLSLAPQALEGGKIPTRDRVVVVEIVRGMVSTRRTACTTLCGPFRQDTYPFGQAGWFSTPVAHS